MSRHHIIITGTGRAGTTFLIQLFTSLGLHTGFTDLTTAVYSNCQAGMEWDIRQADAPYIIKSPFLCDYLDDVLDDTGIVIDQAIIPVRHLYSAAESRRDVTRRTDRTLDAGEIAGGLWHTTDPQQQEEYLGSSTVQNHLHDCEARHPTDVIVFSQIDPRLSLSLQKARSDVKGNDV